MSEAILYHSTNRTLDKDGEAAPLSFGEALFQGLAPDGGLFMPTRIPTISASEIAALRGRPFPKLARTIIGKFLDGSIDDGSIDDSSLKSVTESAFDFDIPVEPLDERTSLLRLDRGPTASFKDFAARFMARMMAELRPVDREYTVLVATSGDTGSAVGEAYRGLDGFRVVILYPRNEVSPDQKEQLEAIGDNVRTLAIDGKFDDCQELVKRAFTDPDLSSLGLSSANSINIGRLLPQITYYFYAYLQALPDGGPVVYSIPSGNFGNSLACEFARRMGLPIERIILAVNGNDTFPKFLESGEYKKISPSRICLSNAMNVGHPSNLARFVELYGGVMTREGEMVKQPDLDAMRQHFHSTSVSDEETLETIRDIHARYGTLVDPHGAVGIRALERYRRDGNRTPAICAQTAHPGKFRDIMRDALGLEVAAPRSFDRYADRVRRVESLSDDYTEFKNTLMEMH